MIPHEHSSDLRTGRVGIGLFDDSSMQEKEANLFAAEFLMGDDDVLDVLNRGTTFFSAASQLSVPMELLDFKFRIMK